MPIRSNESSASAPRNAKRDSADQSVAVKQCAEQPSSSNSHIESLKRQLAVNRVTVNTVTRAF